MIGFGSLGGLVAKHLRGDAGIQFVGVAARPTRRDCIRVALGEVPVVDSAQALLALEPELVIECASHAAFRQYAEPVLAAGVDLIAVSVGVLADADYRERLWTTARRTGASLEIPAGAIGAIDVVAAARHAGLSRVAYVTRKSPRAWSGTVAESMIDLSAVREPRLFFDDTAERAALMFPGKANVTATLALAGVGFQMTRVQLWVDPSINTDIHHIEAEGACGTLNIELANNITPANGKASLLVAMSIVQTVHNRLAVLRI
ncbi:MAG: aspartate dehydrogenase [Betaproteobacteria bacterium]|nr:aspartate dehydrogenase [Betaproteobacteria bacterium]